VPPTVSVAVRDARSLQDADGKMSWVSCSIISVSFQVFLSDAVDDSAGLPFSEFLDVSSHVASFLLSSTLLINNGKYGIWSPIVEGLDRWVLVIGR
jgi:hypothetical protein